jgi:Flp pilus assembly protein TadD
MNTGIQYVNEGEFQEAERAYLRALETDPGNPNIRFSLSTLYIQMERYKEAVDILTSMAADFPENALVHNNLAWIYSTGGAMKNGKLAVRHAREAILTAPIEASMWNTLAEAYYVTGQYDKALRASDYAVDLLRMQNAAEEEIAKFEMQRAKIQRAEEAAKMLLKLDGSE